MDGWGMQDVSVHKACMVEKRYFKRNILTDLKVFQSLEDEKNFDRYPKQTCLLFLFYRFLRGNTTDKRICFQKWHHRFFLTFVSLLWETFCLRSAYTVKSWLLCVCTFHFLRFCYFCTRCLRINQRIIPFHWKVHSFHPFHFDTSKVMLSCPEKSIQKSSFRFFLERNENKLWQVLA